MDEQIDKLYSEFVTEKNHILTKEAEEKYKEFSKELYGIIKDLPVEEKVKYIFLRRAYCDFLNTCCKDHFKKGFESGINVALKLTDRFLAPLYDASDSEEYDENLC
ncbi:MAG: hypothetical protein IJN88_06050 [Clostridia bacterium]|nr:hypothetical protein [Clostridia bacterium]